MPAPLTAAAARAIIASAGWPVKADAKIDTLRRLANGINRQRALGLPLSREAARGHRATPEHPNRKRPRLPASPALYPRGGSKYESSTIPLPRNRPPKPPSPPRPGGRRPLVHDYGGEVTRGQTRVTVERQGFAGSFDEATLDHTTSKRTAERILRNIAAADPYGRIVIEAHDCTRKRGQRWVRIFSNPGHTRGITARYLVDTLMAGEDLEELAIAQAGAGDSPGAGTPLHHVCLWYIYHFPAADLERKRAYRANATRRGPRR